MQTKATKFGRQKKNRLISFVDQFGREWTTSISGDVTSVSVNSSPSSTLGIVVLPWDTIE